MATAKPTMPGAPYRRRRGWAFRIALICAVAALMALVLGWNHITTQARAGASYGARIGCACRYIGGRGLSDCRKDFEDGMRLVWLSQDVRAHSVTARVPLLATETATYREGEGCVPEKWGG